jgi:TolA-binding protein
MRARLVVTAAISFSVLVGSSVVVSGASAFAATASAQRAPLASAVDAELEAQAKHDLEAAKFYYSKRKAYAGAKDRLMDIAAAYPEFTRIDEVYFLLGECLIKTKEPASARHFFELLLQSRPESEFVARAKKRLAELPPGPPEPPAPTSDSQE